MQNPFTSSTAAATRLRIYILAPAVAGCAAMMVLFLRTVFTALVVEAAQPAATDVASGFGAKPHILMVRAHSLFLRFTAVAERLRALVVAGGGLLLLLRCHAARCAGGGR